MIDHLSHGKRKLGCVLVCLGLLLGGCESTPVAPDAEAVEVSEDIVLHPLVEGVWVHTTYFDLPDFGRCPANGLVVIDGAEALLVDLPWTDEQTDVLCDWIAQNHGAAVRTVVPTHFHEDCMGGLAAAHRRGATSWALDKTITLARQRGLPVPRLPFKVRASLRCGGTVAYATYHGPGHTIDNIVAWLPKQRVLFGGCLVKSLDLDSLGNTKDGDLRAYPSTLQKVRVAYPEAKIVVPGHGQWGGPGLIDHTLKLCQESSR